MNRRQLSARHVAVAPGSDGVPVGQVARTAAVAAPQPPRAWTRAIVRPTRGILYWFVAVAILLLQGWQRGPNLVALLAFVVLTLWMLNGVLVFLRFSLGQLRFSRCAESAVFAGTPFAMTLELSNPTRRTQRGLRLDQPLTAPGSWFVPQLRPGETARRREMVTFAKRGRRLWPRVRLSTAYPFGLFSRTMRQTAPDATIVLPRLGRLHVGRLRRLLHYRPHLVHATQRPRRRHPVSQTDFYGLREFRPGDSPRWIHWRTTARVGELMVREFEEPPLDDLTVVVESWLPERAAVLQEKLAQVARANRALISRLLTAGPAPAPEKRRAKEAALARKEEPFRVPLDNLEVAVSLAATILWVWHRQSGAELALALADERLGVRLGNNTASPLESVLECLGEAEGGPNPDLDGLVAKLAGSPRPAGPVLLVTTRASDLADRLAAALGRHVAVLDISQPGWHELFELDGV